MLTDPLEKTPAIMTRRGFLAASAVAAGFARGAEAKPSRIRGLVMVPETLSLEDWPERAKRAGLNTISLHHADSPRKLRTFVESDRGGDFLGRCKRSDILVEFDFHAMRDLVPRESFAKDASLFRMNDQGVRTPDLNFCVGSPAAMSLAVENALEFARAFPTETNRYYYWSDGCGPWCRCETCKELSDSEQPLLISNAIAKALRANNPEAQVAHLACHSSMHAPRKVKPGPGVFLQFAPPRRRYDIPYDRQRSKDQVDSLWFLERNLEVFPAETAQALEYWTDVSLFSRGKKLPLPWNVERFRSDLAVYRSLGIRQVKSFVNDLDADYVRRNGEPAFLDEFGRGLKDVLDA